MEKINVCFKARVCEVLLFLSLSIFTHSGFSQKKDSTLYFRGAVSVTHNGFSFIPSFTLGKPAAVLDIAIGNKRLSFEPQFRFALEGKPWSFIFIYRYRLIDKSRFQFTIGGHLPSIVFKTKSVSTNGVPENVIVSQRFLAGELAPNYLVSKNISVGLYYLFGHGFENDATRNTHFIALRSNFSNIKLSENVFLRFNPQVFYLKVDDQDGFYATYALTLAMKKFPISISNIVNKAIHSEITAKDFDWNVSLIYSFSKDYVIR